MHSFLEVSFIIMNRVLIALAHCASGEMQQQQLWIDPI